MDSNHESRFERSGGTEPHHMDYWSLLGERQPPIPARDLKFESISLRRRVQQTSTSRELETAIVTTDAAFQE
jgi:hypothetical protein